MVPKPTGSEETFHIDAVPPAVTPEVTLDVVGKLKKKEKKEKKKKLKKMMEEGAFMTSTPDHKRKDRSSSDTSPTIQAELPCNIKARLWQRIIVRY